MSAIAALAALLKQMESQSKPAATGYLLRALAGPVAFFLLVGRHGQRIVEDTNYALPGLLQQSGHTRSMLPCKASVNDASDGEGPRHSGEGITNESSGTNQQFPSNSWAPGGGVHGGTPSSRSPSGQNLTNWGANAIVHSIMPTTRASSAAVMTRTTDNNTFGSLCAVCHKERGRSSRPLSAPSVLRQRAILAVWHQSRSGESPRVRVSKPKSSAKGRPRLWRAAAHCWQAARPTSD